MSRDTQAKPQQTEKEFMAAVVEYARLQGWLCYHTYDSRRSEPGFPDLCMTRCTETNKALGWVTQEARIIFVELKVGKNKPTVQQDMWLSALNEAAARMGSTHQAGHVRQGVQVFVWTPADWDDIEHELGRHRV